LAPAETQINKGVPVRLDLQRSPNCCSHVPNAVDLGLKLFHHFLESRKCLFSKHAKAEWRRVMPELTERRILTPADFGSLVYRLRRLRLVTRLCRR
jgi:phage terminase small subunit